MKPHLITRQPKRLFTFGCSFTGYAWMTWPEVIAHDLGIPLYNYGKSGAGNQYIFNTLIQANKFYKFNDDDLIIISWTNVNREDRYLRGEWWTPGTIHLNGIYNEYYIEKFVDPIGYLMRDLASIEAVYKILSQTGCQFHMISMNNFTEYYEQFWTEKFKEQETLKKCKEFYNDVIEKILPSFYDILWNNSMEFKIRQELEMFGPLFADRHPNPKEHLCYIDRVFNHKFSTETIDAVDTVYNIWFQNCYTLSRNKKFLVYHLEKSILDNFIKDCRLIKSQELFLL